MSPMTHAEIQELLGAYALDAVDPEESEIVARHVEECPRCRDELAGHREVAGVLAYSGQEAPEGLWDRVVERIHDSSDTGPGGEHGTALVPPAPAVFAGARPRARRYRLGGRLVGGLAAAAVAVVALLGVEVARLQNRTDSLSGQLAAMTGQPTMRAVQLALAEPGARKILLDSATSGARLYAVILPGGTGYLYGSTLSPLPPSETYQLWGVVGSQTISYGLIGASPARVTEFRAGAGVQALAVTAEVAGGVVQTSHNPVVVGAFT